MNEVSGSCVCSAKSCLIAASGDAIGGSVKGILVNGTSDVETAGVVN